MKLSAYHGLGRDYKICEQFYISFEDVATELLVKLLESFPLASA